MTSGRQGLRRPFLFLAFVFALGFPAFAGPSGGPGGAMSLDLLIDDFRGEDGLSALGTRWRGLSDTVMGGRSQGTAALDSLDAVRCLRLQGRVSLENNGGFIQVAVELDPAGKPLDAADYEGIRLLVRGNGEPGYHVHLRTADTRLPWQYYEAGFTAGPEWTEVRIPFSAFRPRALDAKLDRRRLVRVGIVASKRAFTADVAVGRISFYRATV